MPGSLPPRRPGTGRQNVCLAVPIRIRAAGWAAEADVKGLEERKPDYLLTRFEDLDRFFREHDGNEGL